MLQTKEEKIKVLDVPRTVVLDLGLVRTEFEERREAPRMRNKQRGTRNGSLHG